MEFAGAALRTLIPKLVQLLQEEYNLQKGVRKDIEFLSSELERSQAALRVVSMVPQEQLSELVRLWVRDVREVSYDMEDIVDTFVVRVQGAGPPSKRGVKKFIKEMFRKVSKARTCHDIGQEIKDIRERVKEVAERRDRYKFDIAPTTKIPVDPRITALYTKVTELVGVDETKEEVVTRLTKGDDDQQKRIVSIAGFGGLGKTTLAKVVYDEIKGQFGCTAFVSVSRNHDIKKLLKQMLYAFDKERFKDDIHSTVLDETHLIDLVREFLQNKRYERDISLSIYVQVFVFLVVVPTNIERATYKFSSLKFLIYLLSLHDLSIAIYTHRYLVVIDDIWDIEPWKIIECALMENSMGSRIITTTRIIDVAKQIGGYYRLKPLSDESSEILFYGRIFGSKYCPEQFYEVSKNILKKCGGVPLAIITTSSLLANNSENTKEWYNVCNSIGSGLLGINPSMENMRKILLLSYYDLPWHLKTCLLYLSIFPEDFEIGKGELIWRWVAEGFVEDQQAGDQSFHEIGESYFNELVNRSLIQPTDMDVEGTPQACRVHDTVLDLIISLSTDECFIVGLVFKPKIIINPTGDGKYSMESKIRRLSVHNNTSWPTMMKMPKLRSLTFFKPAGVAIDWMPSLARYHLLRVLDLQGCRLKDLLSLGFVGSLSHLRYLRLSSSNRVADRLPEEIGKLQFLQTLDLSDTAVEELPSSIIGLRQLMCVHGPARFGPVDVVLTLPDGMKNFTSLEVVDRAAVESKCIAEELGHLTQLRVLGIKVVFNILVKDVMAHCEALVESLGKLKKIESLLIDCCFDVNLDGSMEEPLGNLRRLCIYDPTVLPTWIKPASVPILSYLDIRVKYERRDDIRVLGALPCLRHLKFKVKFAPINTRRAWSDSDDEAPEPEAVERRRFVAGPDAFPSVVSCEFECGEGAQSVVPSLFPPGSMPRLQHLGLRINADDFGGGRLFDLLDDLAPRLQDLGLRINADDFALFSLDDLALSHLTSLQSLTLGFPPGRGVSVREVRRSVKQRVRHEVAVHPNNLRFEYMY
ncbi:unnamed protein product [Urochloa decumbens]|uniref:Uncharacterized protein n=1 Tax=Urochloa decumbens TaxID=240449 RepID=A0ABC9B3X9_9POAL